MFKRFCILFFCLLISINSAVAQEFVYRGLGIKRDMYHSDLLNAIFKHSDQLKNDSVTRYQKFIPHQRALDYLAMNKKVDIVIGYATQERIDHYQAINLPLMKGFNGWRISLVHKDNIDIFKSVKTLAQFKSFTPGLFHTWTDNKILEANGIFSTKGTNFDGLYQMLNNKRFDYYPMSVIEAHNNIIPPDLNITVEPHILFTYPICFYFYVNKDNAELAEGITQGFERIISNGVYDKIFEKHYGAIMTKFLTQNRKIIRLTNPHLPKSVPLARKELWIHFKDDPTDGSSLYK